MSTSTQRIAESIALKQTVLQDSVMLEQFNHWIDALVGCFQRGSRVWFCGNGGSAADAQHLAAELSGRFYFDRDPLPAEALHVNTSYLTAVANDYGYAEIFARAVRAQARPGDWLVAFSTSGNSENVIAAARAARELGVQVAAFTGASGGGIARHADVLFAIPSTDTPRIQEVHMLLGHIACEFIEAKLFGN